MRLPSGDHVGVSSDAAKFDQFGSAGSSADSSSRRGVPPRRSTTKMTYEPSFTLRTNAICFPSGDQAGARPRSAEVRTRTSRRSASPVAETTCSPSTASNASSLPSGDHSGALLLVALLMRRMFVPSGRMRKIPPPSRLLAKAITFPSGDHAGAESAVSNSTSIPPQDELDEQAARQSAAVVTATTVPNRLMTVVDAEGVVLLAPVRGVVSLVSRQANGPARADVRHVDAEVPPRVTDPREAGAVGRPREREVVGLRHEPSEPTAVGAHHVERLLGRKGEPRAVGRPARVVRILVQRRR